MQKRRRVEGVAAIVAAASIVGAVRDASAACNSIPGPWSLHSKSPSSSISDIRREFPYRGEVGRIDRALIVPGVTRSIRASSDPRCPSGKSAVAKTAASEKIGLVVKHRGADSKPLVRTYARTEDSQSVQATVAALVKGLGKENVRQAKKPLAILRSQDGLERYELGLPGPRVVARDKIELEGGSLSIVVVETGAGHDEIIASVLASSVGRQTCKNIVTALGSAADCVIACVDRIYSDYDPVEPCGTTVKDLDAFTCGTLQTGALNDFHKQCDINGDGVPNDYGRCIQGADGLEATVCPNGNLAIPFEYTELRKLRDLPNKLTRKLAGRSTVSRGPLDDSALRNPERIVLPGDEFVGTLRPDYTGNPKKPKIFLENDTDREPFLRLHGAVDENESVVILAARIPVAYVCRNTGEACQTFSPTADGEDAICTEEASVCGEPQPQRYFACNGGGTSMRAGMPCTNSSHCGRGGKCNVGAFCVPRGATWGLNLSAHGSACDEDARCNGDAAYPQCGYSLFDFASRATGRDKTTYHLAHPISEGPAAGESGVCRFNRSAICSADGQCQAGTGPCVRYSLEARRSH